MGRGQSILMRMFGRPEGTLGRLGGVIMARMNEEVGAWIVELLEVQPGDHILEVGFGPGVVIRQLAGVAPTVRVAGVDPSEVMLAQARARNASAIEAGQVDLRRGSVESLPFTDNSFDKALALNSMQVWPDAGAGLREIGRVLKPGGRIALGFTHHSRQSKAGVGEMLEAAGFEAPRVVERGKEFCVLASRP